MKKIFICLLLFSLFSAFAMADVSDAHPILAKRRTQHQHVKHHAHRAAKHHARHRHYRSV